MDILFFNASKVNFADFRQILLWMVEMWNKCQKLQNKKDLFTDFNKLKLELKYNFFCRRRME